MNERHRARVDMLEAKVKEEGRILDLEDVIEAAERVQSLTEEAIENSKDASDPYARDVAEVLKKMKEVSAKAIKGEITIDLSERLINSYSTAMALYLEAMENKKAVKAYKRSQAALETASRLLVTVVRVGVVIYAPQLDRTIDRVFGNHGI